MKVKIIAKGKATTEISFANLIWKIAKIKEKIKDNTLKIINFFDIILIIANFSQIDYNKNG